ncbi:MAG: acetate kinase [Bacteroidales bacterium]|nr:acetate kinase [Bacteroidales bacterium]MCF8327229.1 acetate kinase [Bacteroidales bacterium]
MKVLVLNCGSSSIKYQLIEMNHEATLLAKGLIERVGMNDAIVNHKPEGKENCKDVTPVPDHQTGIDKVLAALTDKEHGVISKVNEINAAGHRVAHGGENFSESALVTEKVKNDIKDCIELAPLHNPANLEGILAMEKLLPEIPQVAVFDTSFHQTMPRKAYLYGIPYKYYEKYNVRRYGFHGTSHKFVAPKAANMLGKDWNTMKIITCHLGNGASIAAIDKGDSVDTSMGFTPIEGLVMGTRTGDLDLGVVFYLMDKEKLSKQEVNKILNKESGMLGVSGVSSDMRDIEQAAEEGNERAKAALELYSYRIKKYIGAYAAAMGGVDMIVFTGGVGENADAVRADTIQGLEFLGAKIDPSKNNGLRGKDADISADDSKVKIVVTTTDEEHVIARDTQTIVEAQ